MAAGIMSEAILIIASVVIATSVAGVVMNQVGVFESTFTATTEGQKPISSVDKVDVYFGEIVQVQNIPRDQACVPPACPDDTWKYDIVPSPVWQIMDTVSLNITDNDLQKGVTYQITVITSNGVSDEQIFSLPS